MSRRRWALIAPIVAAAVMRAVFVRAGWNAPLFGDEAALERLVRQWELNGLYTGKWPPAYPWLLKCLHGVFGDSWQNVARVVNGVASTIGVGLTMALASHVGNRRTTIVAGWISALLLSSAAWSALLFTEAVFIVVVLGVCLLIARGMESEGNRRRLFLLAGVAIGVGCLLRAAGVLVFGGIVGGAALAVFIETQDTRRPRWIAAVSALRAALWLVVPALLVLLPWATRNGRLMGESAWLSPTGSGNVALGWSGIVIPFERVGLDPDAIRSAPLGGMRHWLDAPGPRLPTVEEIKASGTSSEWAWGHLEHVVREYPGWTLRSRATNLSDLVSPVSFLHRALRLGQLDGLPGARWSHRLLVVGGVLTSLLVLVLVAWSVTRARGPTWWWCMLGGISLAHALIPMMMFGISRFRAPWEPLLVVAAALAVTTHGVPGRTRRIVGAALCVVLVACLLIALPIVWAVVGDGWSAA